jgi:hypothetical protein
MRKVLKDDVLKVSAWSGSNLANFFNVLKPFLLGNVRDRSLFMAGGCTKEKYFSWQKYCDQPLLSQKIF